MIQRQEFEFIEASSNPRQFEGEGFASIPTKIGCGGPADKSKKICKN